MERTDVAKGATLLAEPDKGRSFGGWVDQQSFIESLWTLLDTFLLINSDYLNEVFRRHMLLLFQFFDAFSY